MSRRSPNGEHRDPFAELGLANDADEAAVMDARRRLAKVAHPDAGGSLEAMQRLNLVAQLAVDDIRRRATPTSGKRSPTPGRRQPSRDPVPAGTRRDHPSFTIEVLPVEAFEALLIVAATLGDVVHDDPPYLLETTLVDPVRGWCRLEIVPDAGASTVSLAVASEPGYPPPSVDAVRDAWIDGLNRLDWSNPDGSLPPS